MGTIYSKRARDEGRGDVDESFSYTQSQIDELHLCACDPVHFIGEYLKLNHPMNGQTPFILRDYQERQCMIMNEGENLICVQPRQSGATLVPLAFIFWEAMFKRDQTLAVCGVRDVDRVRMREQLRMWYDGLPKWLRPDIKVNNRHALEFDSGCRILLGITSGHVARGLTFSRMFVDCFAWSDDQDQEDFWLSNVPLLSSGSKIVLTSTPNGPTNTFAKLWDSAIHNHYQLLTPMKVNALAAHSPQFLAQMLSALGQDEYDKQFEGSFA